MTFVTATPARDAPGFSDEEFRALAALARAEFGLSLAESKKPLVYSRLSRRLKARGVAGFADYLRLLTQPGEENEKLELISALTTNVTSFFRESHHFDLLRRAAAESLVPRARAGGRVRIWSAACSSGQEPYSIALTLLELCPEAPKLDIRILATDIDPAIVRRAQAAVYAAEELASIPQDLRGSHVVAGNGDFSIAEKVKSLVTFAELNLISTWPFKGPFDAIFCRNVAIYFDQDTQRGLWQALSDKLGPDGLLFIGHSERISGPALTGLESVGVTSYRKRHGGAAPRTG